MTWPRMVLLRLAQPRNVYHADHVTLHQPPNYAGYVQWKGWLNGPPAHLADQHDSFQREVGGLIRRGTRVHELGFGEGHFMDWARARGASISGVEIDEALVNAAKERGHRAELVRPGGAIGDLEPGSLDLVVAFDVLEHLNKAELASVALAAAQALRVGGHFVARFPNGASPFSGLYQHGDATHATQLTPGSLAQIIRDSELRLASARNAARPLSGNIAKRMVRGMRYGLQAGIGAVLSGAYYGRLVPMDPNVTVVLVK